MTAPCVSIHQANRHTAARQGLFDGAERGVAQACRDALALHSTEPVAPYLSLHARLPGFTKAALDDALYQHRTLARIACMRTTIHVVPSADLPYFHQACAHTRVPEEERALAIAAAECGLADGDIDRIRGLVLARIAEAGPCTVSELAESIPALKATAAYAQDKPYLGTYSLGSRLVPALCTTGLLVRAEPRGTWRSSQYRYEVLRRWLPGLDLGQVDRAEAVAWLVRRYIERFGPVAGSDVVWWTGLPARDVRESLRALAPELVTVEVRGLPADYLVLRQDVEAIRGQPDEPAPVAWLLPSLDSYIMGFKDRTRFLDPGHAALAIDRAGNVLATAWAGGRIVGLWAQRPDGTVFCRLFAPVGAEARALLDERAAALTFFLAGEVVPPRAKTAYLRAMLP